MECDSELSSLAFAGSEDLDSDEEPCERDFSDQEEGIKGVIHIILPDNFLRFFISSVKWSDPGHFLKSQGNFFCHFHVPFFTYF